MEIDVNVVNEDLQKWESRKQKTAEMMQSATRLHEKILELYELYHNEEFQEQSNYSEVTEEFDNDVVQDFDTVEKVEPTQDEADELALDDISLDDLDIDISKTLSSEEADYATDLLKGISDESENLDGLIDDLDIDAILADIENERTL